MHAIFVAILLIALASPAAADPISVAILTAIGGSTLASSAVAVAVTTTLLSATLSIGLSFVAKALSPKPPKSASAADSSTMVTIREPLAPRRRVYGRARMGGTPAYINANEGVLSIPVMLCDGPITEIERVYFDDIELEIDGSDVVQNGPFRTYAIVKKFLGSVGQPADNDIIYYSNGAWTTSHRLDGIAYVSCQLVWNASAWVGMPNITATVRGVALFDPRTGTTYWTDNAALVLRDILLLPVEDGGVGAAASEIDEASFIAAANICDELIPKGGGGTEKRYTANGILELDTGSSPQVSVQSILTACAGRLSYWGGKWHLTVGAWQSPTFALTDDHLRGPISVETRISRRDQFNAVKGSYREPDDRFVARDYPPITFPGFEAEDGGTRIYTDLPLDWTTSASTAQRLAKIHLYRSREALTAKVACKINVYSVVVGDVITFTHARWGWTNKTFEVVDVEWALADGLAPGIDLTLREISAAVYDWQASEQQLVQASPPTNFPNWNSVSPPVFTLAAGDDELFVAGDGAVQARIKVSIITSPISFVDRFEVRWKLSAESTFTEPVTIGAAGSNTWWITPIYDGQLHDVEVRALTSLGTRSAWAGVYNFFAAGKTTPPPNVATVSISQGLLRWEYPNPPLDFAGFKVRYHSGSYVFWPSGIDAHSGLLSSGSLDVAALLTGPVTLMVKAIDTSGNESLEPAVVVTDLGDPIVANVIVDYDLKAAGFPGTISSGEVFGGDLIGSSTELFWSGSDDEPFYGPGPDLFWQDDTYTNISYAWSYTPDLDLLDSTLSIFATIAGAPWQIQYRESGASLMWDGDDESPFWEGDDSELFWGAEGDFLPWPGQLTPIRRTLFEFQLAVTGGAIQPIVSELRLVFDVPDVMETLGDVPVLAAGTRLPITRTYRVITNVSLTVQAGAGSAVSARIDDKLQIGPLVTALDASGAAVNATVDAIVQGY